MPALAEGLRRLADFSAVQHAEHGGCTLEGVLRLQEAAGLHDEDRRLIAERLADVAPDADRGAVLLGVLIGLFAASDP